jgi:isocitrate dehydrogenase (NAD+)
MNMEYMKAFEALVAQQLARVEKMKSETDFINYQALDKIIIGVIGGTESVPLLPPRLREFWSGSLPMK